MVLRSLVYFCNYSFKCLLSAYYVPVTGRHRTWRVSSPCTESLDWSDSGCWDTCPRGCCGTGTAREQDSTGTQVGEEALGSLWEPCTGLLSCPILADGLEGTGSTPSTLVPWQVDTDRDLGPWGCVARATAAWLRRSLGKVELPPAHTHSRLCWRHVFS